MITQRNGLGHHQLKHSKSLLSTDVDATAHLKLIVPLLYIDLLCITLCGL